MTKKTPPRGISSMKQFETPASNATWISSFYNQGGVRLTFGETADGTEETAVYHTAVFMNRSHFNSFVDLINKIARELDGNPITQ